MSAVFGGSNYLSKATAPVATYPLWMAAWFKRTSDYTLLCLGSTTEFDIFRLRCVDDFTIWCESRNGGSQGLATKGSFSNGTWTLAIGVIASATSRIAYLGSSAGSTETTNIAPDAINALAVGARLMSDGPSEHFVGKLAEVAIWSGAPSGGAIAALAAGDAPSLVDAGNLVFYESLLSGAGTLTNNGSVTFDAGDHPTISYGSVVTTLRPDATNAAGNWLTNAASATLHPAVDETSVDDADYIISGANPTNDVCNLGLSDFSLFTASGYDVVYRYKKQESGGTGTMNLRIRLMEGTTPIASATHNGISTSFVTGTFRLSDAEYAAISDPTALRVEITANP